MAVDAVAETHGLLEVDLAERVEARSLREALGGDVDLEFRVRLLDDGHARAVDGDRVADANLVKTEIGSADRQADAVAERFRFTNLADG